MAWPGPNLGRTISHHPVLNWVTPPGQFGSFAPPRITQPSDVIPSFHRTTDLYPPTDLPTFLPGPTEFVRWCRHPPSTNIHCCCQPRLLPKNVLPKLVSCVKIPVASSSTAAASAAATYSREGGEGSHRHGGAIQADSRSRRAGSERWRLGDSSPSRSVIVPVVSLCELCHAFHSFNKCVRVYLYKSNSMTMTLWQWWWWWSGSLVVIHSQPDSCVSVLSRMIESDDMYNVVVDEMRTWTGMEWVDVDGEGSWIGQGGI